jgi:hypothetical protein
MLKAAQQHHVGKNSIITHLLQKGKHWKSLKARSRPADHRIAWAELFSPEKQQVTRQHALF